MKRSVTLRALLLEDFARTADVAGMRSTARLLRRADVCEEDLAAVSSDLRDSVSKNTRNAGVALMKLRTGAGPVAAVQVLADYCGLDVAAWIDATADEQRVQVAEAEAEAVS